MEYKENASRLRFALPSTKLLVLGSLTLIVGTILWLGGLRLAAAGDTPILGAFIRSIWRVAAIVMAAGITLLLSAFAYHVLLPDCAKICGKVRRALCHPSCGNPLHLRNGEKVPAISCVELGKGIYALTIRGGAVTVDVIADAASAISSALDGRYTQYAITQTDTGVAYDRVTFRIEDVTVDRSLTFSDIEQMRPADPTKLRVQDGAEIDLTTSGSMLVAGKTRSGKTTGIIALLLQVLLAGRDAYGSQVVIIDPKQAELSRLPHVVTLDTDGEARGILETLKRFSDTIVTRQAVLNNLSEQVGDAVKWWSAGMHPSFLFIDEYVACRSIFPKKPAKDSDYCLDSFDALVKRIVTMGASAGCYVIISIAEASVQEGGLPAMLRSAMSTRILFRPTRSEALLLWDKAKLETMPERVYGPGDAWFSSTDGVHDNVSYVHFPRMDFLVYKELGRLLSEYYKDNPHTTPPAAE